MMSNTDVGWDSLQLLARHLHRLRRPLRLPAQDLQLRRPKHLHRLCLVAEAGLAWRRQEWRSQHWRLLWRLGLQLHLANGRGEQSSARKAARSGEVLLQQPVHCPLRGGQSRGVILLLVLNSTPSPVRSCSSWSPVKWWWSPHLHYNHQLRSRAQNSLYIANVL